MCMYSSYLLSFHYLNQGVLLYLSAIWTTVYLSMLISYSLFLQAVTCIQFKYLSH